MHRKKFNSELWKKIFESHNDSIVYESLHVK